MKNRKRHISISESTDLNNRKRKRTINEISKMKNASSEMIPSELEQRTETMILTSFSGICARDSIHMNVDNLSIGELQYDQHNISSEESVIKLDSNLTNNEDILIKNFGNTFVSKESTKEEHVLHNVNISHTCTLAKPDGQIDGPVLETMKEIKSNDHLYTSETMCNSSSPTDSKKISVLKMSNENDSSDNTIDNNFLSINYCNSASAISNSNNINASNAVKNQSIMNAKTVMSEITQTTAKVSIGNTTISVPLLKPVCSSKIVQDSVDIYKNQIKIKPQSHPQQGQLIPHVNPKHSTVVNLRRGQKLNPPTIVSLSQLQIKPSNNAKIVQATVVSNKLQLKNYTDVITQSTINISSIRGKPNYTQKLCYPKQASMLNHIAVRNKQCEGDLKSAIKNLTSHSISKPPVDSSGDFEYHASISNDNLYNTNTHILPLVTKVSVTNRSKYLDSAAEIQTRQQELDLEYSAIVIPANKVFSPDTPPILSCVSKQNVNNIPLQKFKNTIREVIPQHNTSSTSGATMSNITTVFATSTAPITQQNNSISQSINCSSSKSSSNTVFNIPQTISLMLSKTTTNDSSTAVLPMSSAISIQNQVNRNFTNQFTKENQFPKMITLKKTVNEHSQHDIIKSVPLTPVAASSSHFYINQNPGIIDLPCSQTKQNTSLNKSKQIPNSPTELNIEREKPNQSINNTVMKQHAVDMIGLKLNCIKNNSEVNRSEKKRSSSMIITSVCDRLNDSTCIETTKVNNKKKYSRESPPRTEESQNILLKQLLKNTSLTAVQGISSIATSSMCNQALSNRKINVRAPSLGLVSSLEAQLARPVMPPVSETTGLIVDEPLNKETEDSSIKLKQPLQIISKETSFVSNPRFCLNIKSNIISERMSPHTQEVSASIHNNLSSTTDECRPNLVSCSSPTDGFSNLAETYICVSPNEGLNKTRDFESTCFNLGNDFRCDKKTFSKTSYTVPENYTKPKDPPQSDTINVKVTNSMEKETCFSGITHASAVENNNSSLAVLTQAQSENPTYEKDSNGLKGLTTSSETTCKSYISGYFRTVTDSKNYSSPLKFSKNKDKVSNSLKYSNNPRRIQETNENIPEVKQRKKRKRDVHRQNILCNNTETNNAVELTNSKKRSRKPGKTEEDYDIFMDNLVNQMRKMASLDVLEPLLCNNKGICNMYGFSDLSKLFKNKGYENGITSKLVHEQNQQWIKVRDFYGEQPFGCNKRLSEKKHLLQNNFYDQEFLTDTIENVEEKFYKMMNNTKFCNNMDSSENILAKNTSIYSIFQWDTFTQTTFPGLVVINDNLGRQSPVIPLVKPVPFKVGSIIAPPSLGHPKSLFRKQLFISKFNEEENNLTVILTMSSDNVLNVLKDLANILNISPISSFKIIEDVTNSNVPCAIGNYKLRENQRTKYDSDIQDILNGVKKLCENCGFSASKMTCVPSVSLKSSTKNLNRLETSEHIYFCSKACCINFKYQLMSRSAMKVNMPQNFKELIIKSGFMKHRDLSITSNISNLKKPRFKYFKMDAFPLRSPTTNITPNGITNILLDLDITMLAPYKSRSEDEKEVNDMVNDIRRCILCNENGDGISDEASRLLNIDVDKWVHLNCALWSNGVYETISGGLINVETALEMGKTQICSSCHQLGATIRCFKSRCESVYHLLCAKKEGCVFYKNKSFHCQTHSKTLKDHELLTLGVQRRVFVERDESHQIINIMQHQDLGILLRIGSIILLNVGKLLSHQLDTFHSTNCIYPIGYKSIRFYWSLKNPNTRCRYICTISESSSRPEFTVRFMDTDNSNLELRDLTPNLVWFRILESIVAFKKKQRQVQIFPKFISGDDLFGFTEPFIVRILESLPGVGSLNDYRFKYGRNSLLELPLGIHSSGAARTEPQQRQVLGLKKPHTQRTATTANQRLSNSIVVGEVACPYSKQFIHSKSSQYKKMNQEWRNNVYLARSKIQGLGLYAARDLEKHTMVIEYIGEVIRTEVSEIRERQYAARNRGIYMFRLDEDRIVDATLSGGLARYINHSCNPNCVTEIVDVDREVRIIIFAKRRISRGEELSYDYKFDIEDDAHKLPCMCGAPNCRKWMN